MKEFKMSFENSKINDKYKMPQLTVKANENIVGYLTPFRAFKGYKFQISMTEDGDWDLGSSPVLFMKDFKSLPDFCLKEHLRGQVALCIVSHHKIMSDKSLLAKMCGFRKNKEDNYVYTMADLYSPYYGEEAELNKFLNLCVEWFNKL